MRQKSSEVRGIIIIIASIIKFIELIIMMVMAIKLIMIPIITVKMIKMLYKMRIVKSVNFNSNAICKLLCHTTSIILKSRKNSMNRIRHRPA